MILQLLSNKLFKTKTVEELFGPLNTIDELRNVCKELYKIVYVDVQPDNLKPLAEKATIRLNLLKELAEKKLEDGTYGKNISFDRIDKVDKVESYCVELNGKHFPIKEQLFVLDYFTVYQGDNCIVKISNDGGFEQANKEIRVLNSLGENQYFPKLVGSTTVLDNQNRRVVNIFPSLENKYSIRQIKEKYPGGVGAKTAAWMINRMLEFTVMMHNKDYIHCGILPHNVFFDKVDHGIFIVDFSQSNKGEVLKTINGDYRDFYPPEVFHKEGVSTGTDLYMIAKCALLLMGGKGFESVPKEIYSYIDSWLIPNRFRRPSDLCKTREQFGDLLKSLFGKPKYVQFDI